MKKFLITTAIGGALFLVPLVLVVAILGQAYQIMMRVAEPIQQLIPFASVAGVGVVNLLALLLILFTCLLAGLIAQSGPARRLYTRLDAILLEIIPGYAWTKTVVASVGGAPVTEGFKPVLVTLDDQMQLAFELERVADNLVVVFFPGAPDVRSGTVAYVTADRVQPVDASFLSINKSLKHMGKGAGRLLPQHMLS